MVEVDDTATTKSNDPKGQPRPRATYCRDCARHFSATARFCPFDGTPLAQSQRVASDDPLLGQLIDSRYDVIRVLGEGGMGIVYEVRHQLLGRHLALKVLRSDLARDRKLCQRFIREARAAAKVEHPNVVRITDFGALPSGQPYFVMELLRGESLTRVMSAARPMSLDRFVPIVEQLVDALSAAHGADVIHRDLKPDNIQILREGSGAELVKILDFGLARVAGASRLTKQGFVFGTPHYMSPEQAHGDPVDHRADIYALGVLMYEMLTGQLPFDADSYTGVLAKHIYEPPLHPSKLVGRKTLGALEPLILRCLEKKPHKRHASVSLVGDELRAAVRRTESGFQVVRRRLRTKRVPIRHAESQAATKWRRARHYVRTQPIVSACALVLLAVLGWGVVSRWWGDSADPNAAMAPELAPTPQTAPLVSSARGARPSQDLTGHETPQRAQTAADAGLAGGLDQSDTRMETKPHGGDQRRSAPRASVHPAPTWVTRRPDEAHAEAESTRALGNPDIVDPWAEGPRDER